MRSALKYMHNYLTVGICLLMLCLTSCGYEKPDDGLIDLRFRAYIQKEKNLVRAAGYDALGLADVEAFQASVVVSNGERFNTTSIAWDGSNLSSNMRIEPGEYWFYGFMPLNNNASFNLATKTLSIPNIAPMGRSEAMLIKASNAVITSGENTVVLQMDRMLAKVSPYFYVNLEYQSLRDIQIKEVVLRLPSASTQTAIINYSSDPYVLSWNSENIHREYVETFPVATPVNLPTTIADALSIGEVFICPGQSVANLEMTVTYDVYDKAGTLMRENATATNTILVNYNNLERASNYKLYIQVMPTYLYKLSDYDESSVLLIK